MPQWGTSNEYPQWCFYGEIRKIIQNYHQILLLNNSSGTIDICKQLKMPHHFYFWICSFPKVSFSAFRSNLMLTIVLLNLDIPCLCKQYRSRSVGFFRSQLIWICTVCYSVCKFLSTIWIKESDWLTIRSGCGILIYSAWQGLIWTNPVKPSAAIYCSCHMRPTETQICLHIITVISFWLCS